MSFQVMGESGITGSCLVELDKTLSGPSQIERATVLTNDFRGHLFILWERIEQPGFGFIIPAGFRSGPGGGEGVRGFSLALCMLHDYRVPIDCLEVRTSVFDQINRGSLPGSLQTQIIQAASPCAMPISGWTLVKHWELTQEGRLWRVQGWRGNDFVIQWNEQAIAIDIFNWELSDKLNQACETLAPNSRTEDCQQVGLILRDTWIEFSHIARKYLGKDPAHIGKNDVKGIIKALNLPHDVTQRASKAYDSTLELQHRRGAKREEAIACFNNSTEAMAEIISICFPGQRDPRRAGMVPPN